MQMPPRSVVLIVLFGVGVLGCGSSDRTAAPPVTPQVSQSAMEQPNQNPETSATTDDEMAGPTSGGPPGIEGDTTMRESGSKRPSSVPKRFEEQPFGQLPDGRKITLLICQNRGLLLKMINYGAIVVALETADRDGNRANINLGFQQLDGYLERHPYFGATVGRYCNRIAGGKFSIGGTEYTLFQNDGENHLHGGKDGLDRVLWKAEKIDTADEIGIRFTYESPDGEEGYPGNLRVTADYVLTGDQELRVQLMAETDKPTPVNLTNHCYWNLGGAGTGSILDHEVMINAEQYLAADESLVPTGEVLDVNGTPLDFRKPQPIGARLGELKNAPQGYDHCFVISAKDLLAEGEDDAPDAAAARDEDERLSFAAMVKHAASGRVMLVYTTQPGIQFYSGNFLDGEDKSGGFKQYEGFCLETQHYPDSPNHPEFPSTILKPGELYQHVTSYKFHTE